MGLSIFCLQSPIKRLRGGGFVVQIGGFLSSNSKILLLTTFNLYPDLFESFDIISSVKKILIVIGIFIFLIIIYAKNTYDWAPEKARSNGGEFAQACNDIQGKPFTIENISKVNGFIDLNGTKKVTKEQVEDYINKDPNEYPLSIYKDSWFKGPNIKYSWICSLRLDKNTLTIISSAKFYETD